MGGGRYSVEPQFIDANVPLELKTPFPALLVRRVFPLRTNTLFEQRIIRLEWDLARFGNIVENPTKHTHHQTSIQQRGMVVLLPPELFDRIKCNDLL